MTNIETFEGKLLHIVGSLLKSKLEENPKHLLIEVKFPDIVQTRDGDYVQVTRHRLTCICGWTGKPTSSFAGFGWSAENHLKEANHGQSPRGQD